MANNEDEQLEFIKIRFALAFKKLLEENIVVKEREGIRFNLVTNANQLAEAVQMRPATITDILNAKSLPGGLTIHLILEALGKSFTEFGRYYDDLSQKELEQFRIDQRKK